MFNTIMRNAEAMVAEETAAIAKKISDSTQQMMLAMHGSVESLTKTSSFEFDDDSLLCWESDDNASEFFDTKHPENEDEDKNQSDSRLHLMPDLLPDRSMMDWDIRQGTDEANSQRSDTPLHLMPDLLPPGRSMMDWETEKEDDATYEPLRFHGLG